MQPQLSPLAEQDLPVSSESSMTPANAPVAPPESERSRRHEPSIREIIEAARTSPVKARGALLCLVTTAGLLYSSFTPINQGWLAWLALTPLLLLCRLEAKPRAMYRSSMAAGLLWSLSTLQWMRLGDDAMYVAWFALAFYLALYFPAFLAVTRGAVRRLRVPLLIAAPVCWVGLEYLRAHLMTGFAWYFLGHTQYAWPEMIQISDLVGAYGVSFTVVMVSACLAALCPARWLERLNLLPAVEVPDEFRHLPTEELQLQRQKRLDCARPWRLVAVTLCLFGAVLTYGVVRRSQAEFTPGPRVGLVQGNFPTSMKHDENEFTHIYQVHEGLTGLAVRHQPDLIVWPETMFRWPLRVMDAGMTDADLIAIAPPSNGPVTSSDQVYWVDSFKDSSVRKHLRMMSEKAGVPMMIGMETLRASPSGLKIYNSATLVTPREGITGRYDKMHRVIFGEYVPLREELPFLEAMTPIAAGFGLSKGEGPEQFALGSWTVSPVICFEDTVPHLVRDVVRSGEKKPDMLVNLTNDGWFKGSSELDQHLITSAFRAVENRTPLVRAVNTGISAVIDGDGVVREPDVFLQIDIDRQSGTMKDAPTTLYEAGSGRWRKSVNAVVVSTVPLDHRTSFYSRSGDWFAQACLLSTALSAAASLFICRRRPAA